MKAGVAVVPLFVLLLGTVASAFAIEPRMSEESQGSVRRASVLRGKAETLRDQANHLRDGEEARKPNVAKAKQLEKQADALEAQANRADSQNWPPR